MMVIYIHTSLLLTIERRVSCQGYNYIYLFTQQKLNRTQAFKESLLPAHSNKNEGETL